MLKDQVKKVSPLGGGIELCGSSSCLRGLKSVLNTEGILTLPMFLLSDGSLIQMWSVSFAQWCRLLLSLSIIVKSFSSAEKPLDLNLQKTHSKTVFTHHKGSLTQESS